MTAAAYRFERLQRRQNRKGFTCGTPALDRYLAKQARQDQERRLAVTYVLIEPIAETVVGFYSLSMFSIVAPSLPGDVINRLPRYEAFPSVLIGRLAVDQRYQHAGFGRNLLLDALARSLRVSEEIGAMAVIVDAKVGISSFYEHFGFSSFLDLEDRLYLLMDTVAQLDL